MPPKRFNATDLGNAEFLKYYASGNLLFNYRNKMWYEWNGVKWSACHVGQEVQWAKRGVRAMLKHASTINNANKRKAYAMWALRSEAKQRVMAMLEIGRTERGIADSGDGWDIDPMVLGCPGGVLDLRTGKMMKPDKKVKLVSSLALDPNDKAKCPRWQQFLEEIYMGDQEIIGFMKRVLGYSLTGSVKEQAVFCLYGLGANGKSTLTDTILSLFGQYGYAMPFSTIEHSNKQTISNDLAQLYGRRFVIASETQEAVKLNEGRLKALTGGDVVTARFMYKDLFSYKPQAKFILSFNHKPLITDDSEGAWRRIHLIEHKRIFAKHERDGDLPQTLLKELPGILNWMLEGCLEWQRDGLRTPQSVLAATEEYRQEMNPLREFIDENCQIGDFSIPVTELWQLYETFCDVNREKFKLSKRSFNSRMETMGFRRQTLRTSQTSVEKCWIGLGLASKPTSNYGVNAVPVN